MRIEDDGSFMIVSIAFMFMPFVIVSFMVVIVVFPFVVMVVTFMIMIVITGTVMMVMAKAVLLGGMGAGGYDENGCGERKRIIENTFHKNGYGLGGLRFA